MQVDLRRDVLDCAAEPCFAETAVAWNRMIVAMTLLVGVLSGFAAGTSLLIIAINVMS